MTELPQFLYEYPDLRWIAMETIDLGNTGLRISILGFGTMRLPIRSRNPDFTRSITLINHAMQKGINFFDVGTFYCHHRCETAFGKATRGLSRRRFIVSGKNSSHQTRDIGWLTQLKKSLSLFYRKHFDLYFIHDLRLETWKSYFIGEGILEQIRHARDRGLILHLGFSSHDSPENVRALIDTGFFEAVILPFNLLQQDYEETMDHAHHEGIGMIVMNPLAGGILAKASLLDDDSTLGFKTGTPVELALNFVLSQPFVHTVLSGMESETEIDENCGIVENRRFSRTELDQIKRQISHEKKKRIIPCTSCGYCLPCPQGIDIPEIMRIFNAYSLLKGRSFFVRDYSALSVTAECCIKCETCIEKCPQGISIPDIMEDADKLFQG